MTVLHSSDWQRVSRRRPCPVCGKPDWCMYVGPDDSPRAVLCARVESPKRCGEAGCLHVLRDDGPTWAPWRRTIRVAVRKMSEPQSGEPDFEELAANYRAAVKPEVLVRLAVALGVSADALNRLGIGWSDDRRAWSFPMYDAAGDVLGIRLRLADGRKLSMRGGREGLFLPCGLATFGMSIGGRLLVAEGPTDTATLLDLGFDAAGRPSCTGGAVLLSGLVRRWKPSQVAIVADGDEPGRRGAERLAAWLAAYCADVRVITPPAGVKDAREWKRRGATRANVLEVIDAAPVRKLRVLVRARKAGCHARRS